MYIHQKAKRDSTYALYESSKIVKPFWANLGAKCPKNGGKNQSSQVCDPKDKSILTWLKKEWKKICNNNSLSRTVEKCSNNFLLYFLNFNLLWLLFFQLHLDKMVVEVIIVIPILCRLKKYITNIFDKL